MASSSSARRGHATTYQLLRERDLLELHLVDAGMGGAEQSGSRSEESSLHDGQ